MAQRCLQSRRLNHHPNPTDKQHLGPSRRTIAECPQKVQIPELGRSLHPSRPNSYRPGTPGREPSR